MKVLLSAFACDPSKGSEPSHGWNWAIGLAKKGFEVHCFTREEGRRAIEKEATPANLHFHYHALPLGMEKMYYASTASMYLYYLLWQFTFVRKAKKLHRSVGFNLAHHVTWGSTQMGSFLYKLGIPFIFGPAGGGQKAPVSFKKYFLEHWAREENREKIANLLVAYSPSCKKMLNKANTVLVVNEETKQLVESLGAKNVFFAFDSGLPDDFFPENFTPKQLQPDQLKLIWIGRFMPRKGVLLMLEVMKELKNHPGITLTVVGDGEMRDVFTASLQTYALQNTVHWKGAVPFSEVRNYYATHDVFLYTSLRDSGGMQLFEANAFGLPVITNHLHGPGTIVNDATGIRCACETPEMAIAELKKAILHLYNNPEKVKAMSIAAHAFARRQNWPEKIDSIVNQYYPV
jgi:glycosyltransferase involved in cell wall biosynthesis